MIENKDVLFNILQWEKNSIPYRPEVAREIWVVSAIILQQMIYRRNWKKFYKFTEPSKNEKYRGWDSWTEELWMNIKQFKNNLKKIAFKLGKTKNEIEKENALIIYYTDSNRLTWYELNLDNIYKLLNKCYMTNYLVNDKREDSIVNDKREDTNTIQKNTTENTKEVKNISLSSNLELQQLKSECKKYVEIWNKIFWTNYSFTDILFSEWKKLRGKYDKEILEKWISNYLKTKKKRDWKDFKTKYTMTPLAFLKQKSNWIVSYL